MERQFILEVTFIFPYFILVKYRSALFPFSLSTLLHHQPLLWAVLPLGLIIFLKKNDLMRERGIIVLINVTVMEVELIEGCVSR